MTLLAWLGVQTWRLLFKSDSRSQPQPLQYGSVLYIFAYLGAVLFSISFFDASTKFQPRILAPIYISLMMLVVMLCTWLWKNYKRVLKGLIVAFAIITLAVSTQNYLQAISVYKEAGQGYASWIWHDSLVMASLRSLPPGTAIYTNTPPAVYFVTGRASRVVPTPVDPVDNLPRGNYQQEVSAMRADLLAGRAVLALFDTTSLEDTFGTVDAGTFIDGLTLLQKTQGDVLYGKP